MARARPLWLFAALMGAAGLVGAVSFACSYGAMTETLDIEGQRDFSGIASPGVGIPRHPNLHTRATWGTGLSYAALGYENAPPAVRALFDFADPTVTPPRPIEDQSPLQFFSTPHTDEEGVGPLFNQRACIGCHNNSADNKNNLTSGPGGDDVLAGVNQANTPVSRGGRQGPTDYSQITKLVGNPPTVAFTLYGDYNPSSGAFDPLTVFGGPLQHVVAIGYCGINLIPPIEVDPSLAGGLDPVTGLSPLGERRATGERAAPPYVGRGLMEAIYWGDIVANEDPQDQIFPFSSLEPKPDLDVCPGDCISGRHNESAASQSFVGGDPLVRVGRFGLRGAGTTLLQFDVGGSQGEIGLTSPFAPNEQPNVDTVDPVCMGGGPTPNISTGRVESTRDLIRNISPPMQASALYEDPPADDLAKQVQAGAVLFGLDLQAFRDRMTRDDIDPANYTNDTNQAIANDHQLGCATCHVPVMRTGVSPASLGGAENLSNRWAPIFSDLLIHQNPEVPYAFAEQWANAEPVQIDPASCTPAGCDPTRTVPAPYPLLIDTANGPPATTTRGQGPLLSIVSRNLTDYAVVPSVTGLAEANEFRTPPLMGLGKVGPPFGHDARVFLNVIGAGAYPGTQPVPAARMEFTSADRCASGSCSAVLSITTMDLAVLAAIELHDLPAPPTNPATHVPDYVLCPKLPPFLDICGRASRYRGEARNTMEKFRALTLAQQLTVVKFLEAL